jgi:hypothetical protein
MRARRGIDRLSGMDVRAAIRRTRLPFVASLLLAALLGVPATVETGPVAGPGVVASPASLTTIEVKAPAGESIVEPAEATVVPEFRADASPPVPVLTGRAQRAAAVPRAPPTV